MTREPIKLKYVHSDSSEIRGEEVEKNGDRKGLFQSVYWNILYKMQDYPN